MAVPQKFYTLCFDPRLRSENFGQPYYTEA